MSITPNTAASSIPWLPVTIIGGVLLVIIAFTLVKKIGRSQTQGQVAQLGTAVGFDVVDDASESTPPAELAGLKTLTHGRSHRFAHVMNSGDGQYLFQLNYDTGLLHRPGRWSYVVCSAPIADTGPTFLVLPTSAPDDLAAELGFQDAAVQGRTVRSEDVALAQGLLAAPAAADWLAAYPDAVVEYGSGFLTVMMPGEVADDGKQVPLADILAANAALRAAIATP